jgi:hypothetical protein
VGNDLAPLDHDTIDCHTERFVKRGQIHD